MTLTAIGWFPSGVFQFRSATRFCLGIRHSRDDRTIQGDLSVERVTGVVERAVADALESDGDRKPRGAIALVKSDSAA
jgi:hypothetical protein